MKFVNALNKDTGQIQSVPANYVDNPNIFGGAFTRPDAPAAATAAKESKTSRKSEPADPPITDAASPAHATKE